MDYTLDDDELKKAVYDKLSDKIVERIWEPFDYSHGDYDKRKSLNRKARQEIIDKIEWKNAPAMLSETVVKKFFERMITKD